MLLFLGTVLEAAAVRHRLASIPDPFSVAYAPARICRTEPFTVTVRAAILPGCLPAICVDYALVLENAAGARLAVTVPLPLPGAFSAATVPVEFPGRYRPVSATIEVGDLPGFIRLRIPVPSADDLVILPAPRRTELPLPATDGGERHRVSPTHIRSDELLDSRKYVIGDDPRKINWKLYGHSGELFIRQGEFYPPPRSRIHVVLNTELSPRLFSGPERLRYFRRLVETCAGYLETARGHGLAGTLIMPGKVPCSIHSGQLDEILADAAPDTGEPPLNVPEHGMRGAVMFTAPGSPLTGSLAAMGATVFLVDRDHAEEKPRSLWHTLLFRDARKAGSRDASADARFDAALDAEIGGTHALAVR